MAGENMHTASDVALARIEGDIKRIFDKFEQYTKDADRRDREHAEFSANVNQRLNGHSDRIRAVEDKVTSDRSERAGIGKAFKWAYVALGGGVSTVVLGAAAVAAKVLGV